MTGLSKGFYIVISCASENGGGKHTSREKLFDVYVIHFTIKNHIYNPPRGILGHSKMDYTT